MPIWYCMWRTHSIQVQEDHCVIVTLRFPNIYIFLIYNITDCVFYCDGAFLALHVKFRYLVSSLVLRDWGSPIYIYFLIYNITDCVFYCDGAFLALHVKFRYSVSSLVLRDCLYPISLFGLLTDLTNVKILS